MRTPYAAVSNTQLQFRLATAQTTEDQFGNPQPVYQTVTVAAYLYITSGQSLPGFLQSDFRGIQNAISLEGYCTDPATLPAGIDRESQADCTFDDEPGKFTLVLINPPYGRQGLGALLEAKQGTKIAGFFVS